MSGRRRGAAQNGAAAAAGDGRRRGRRDARDGRRGQRRGQRRRGGRPRRRRHPPARRAEEAATDRDRPAVGTTARARRPGRARRDRLARVRDLVGGSRSWSRTSSRVPPARRRAGRRGPARPARSAPRGRRPNPLEAVVLMDVLSRRLRAYSSRTTSSARRSTLPAQRARRRPLGRRPPRRRRSRGGAPVFRGRGALQQRVASAAWLALRTRPTAGRHEQVVAPPDVAARPNTSSDAARAGGGGLGGIVVVVTPAVSPRCRGDASARRRSWSHLDREHSRCGSVRGGGIYVPGMANVAQ